MVVRRYIDFLILLIPTVISCNLCILSFLGCIPTNIPGVPCVLAAASTIIGGVSLDVSTGVSWLGCGLSLTGGALPGALCIIGVLKDCYGVGALGRRRKRTVEDTVRDLVEAYYPIYHTMLVGAEILGDEAWIEIEDYLSLLLLYLFFFAAASLLFVHLYLY